MMSDMIVDFENSLKNGYVYLVEVELPMQDAPEDVPDSIVADLYLVASSWYQAQYIAQTMYPDATSVSVYEEPVNEFDYAARRNRSIL
jgi:hypothetical protein